MQCEMKFFTNTPINVVRLWIDRNDDGHLSRHEEIPMLPTSAGTWQGQILADDKGKLFVCRFTCLQNTQWQFKISGDTGESYDSGPCMMTQTQEQLVGRVP